MPDVIPRGARRNARAGVSSRIGEICDPASRARNRRATSGSGAAPRSSPRPTPVFPCLAERLRSAQPLLNLLRGVLTRHVDSLDGLSHVKEAIPVRRPQRRFQAGHGKEPNREASRRLSRCAGDDGFHGSFPQREFARPLGRRQLGLDFIYRFFEPGEHSLFVENSARYARKRA